MDIVYPFRHGPYQSIELRYSLRSLKNIKHDRVFIVGDLPDRCANVVHIPYSERSRKGVNVANKYSVMCTNSDISDDFILMNDDYYILEPIEQIEYYKYGALIEHINNILKYNPSYKGNNYYNALNDAYRLFPGGDDFEVHAPIVFNKEKFLKILRKYKGRRGAKRSLYCNYRGIEGVFLPNTPNYKNRKNLIDCKIFDEDMIYVQEGQPFLSSAESIINHPLFIALMYRFFPTPCKYEK